LDEGLIQWVHDVRPKPALPDFPPAAGDVALPHAHPAKPLDDTPATTRCVLAAIAILLAWTVSRAVVLDIRQIYVPLAAFDVQFMT